MHVVCSVFKGAYVLTAWFLWHLVIPFSSCLSLKCVLTKIALRFLFELYLIKKQLKQLRKFIWFSMNILRLEDRLLKHFSSNDVFKFQLFRNSNNIWFLSPQSTCFKWCLDLLVSGFFAQVHAKTSRGSFENEVKNRLQRCKDFWTLPLKWESAHVRNSQISICVLSNADQTLIRLAGLSSQDHNHAGIYAKHWFPVLLRPGHCCGWSVAQNFAWAWST
jgi:hypothetical protein